MTLKLKRVAMGSYETPDGRYSIYRDPTRMAGLFGGSWNTSLCGKRIDTHDTLRDARRALEKRIERPK
jgi:hypothetical protein